MLLRLIIVVILSRFLFTAVSSQTIAPLLESRNVKIGDNITIDCALQDALESTDYVWVHNGVTIFARDIKLVYIDRYNVVRTAGGSSLIITKVHFDDRGLWECDALIAEDKNRQPLINVTLIIRSPPIWVHVTPQKDFTLSLNDSIRLSCNATGDPMPTVTWTSAHGSIILPDGTVTEYTVGNVLNLTNVTEEHHGEYFCHASNGLKPSISEKFTVKIPFRPQVHVHSTQLRAPKNRTTNIGCVVYAYPQVTAINDVTWYKESVTIQNDQRYRYDLSPGNDGMMSISILTTPKVDDSVAGTYMCQFTNNHGTASETITLEVGPYIAPDTGASRSGASPLSANLLPSVVISVVLLLSVHI